MPKKGFILLAILIAYKSMNETPQQIAAKPNTSPKTPDRLLAILSSILALGLAAIALTAGSQAYIAEAQEQNQEQTTETTTENNQEKPEPPIPNEVGSVYNEQMTLEEVIAECQAGATRITDEFNRLTNSIQPHETDYPEYYETETTKIGIWLRETTAGQNTECEAQKEAALARQLPASPVPGPIATSYHDQMTLEEVEAECENVDQRITAEHGRLLTLIEDFKDSHPEYYETETTKIGIWLRETTAGQNTECEAQKEAALARQLPASPVPGPIATSYHDQMTLEEVEAECENVDQRITAEHGRLLTLIEDFKDSHPEYYAEEKARLDAWRQLTNEEQQTKCEEQKEEALARQLPPTPVDDLYPQVSQEVKDLATELGLTDEAKTILYNNNPELFDNPSNPDFTCSDHSLEEEVYVYGCWDYHGSIKVLRDNSTAITLAHELLHAVYYDAYISYRNRDLDRQIDAAAANDPIQTQIILNAYAKQLDSLSPQAARYVRRTELHSFIGTQFTNISPDLEEHYNRYFKDRRVVLNIFRDWLLDTRAKLAERQKYNQQLLYQVGEYQKCLNDPYATTAICQRYLPGEEQYLAYDECLTSNKTFLRDCRRLKPATSVAFIPILPPPTPPPAVSEPDNQSTREAEELISRTNQRQQEAEEDFISQLAEHEHELATDTSNPEDQEGDQTEPSDEDDDIEEGEENDEQRTSLIKPKDSGNGSAQLPNVLQRESGEAATLPIWLLLILAPVAAASSFTVTHLILKTRRQGSRGLLEIQQQAGRIPLLSEIPKEANEEEMEEDDQAREQDE